MQHYSVHFEVCQEHYQERREVRHLKSQDKRVLMSMLTLLPFSHSNIDESYRSDTGAYSTTLLYCSLATPW